MRPKKGFPILIVCCCFSLISSAQDTTYFDTNWKVTGAANASYFRLKEKYGSGWKVKDCYLTGDLQMEGVYSDDSCKIENGKFSYYNDKKQLVHACQYKDGELDGDDLMYYDNGQIRTHGKYAQGDMIGNWLGYYPSGKKSAEARFKKDRQVAGNFYNEDGTHNGLVTEFSRAASFPNGLPALQRFLIRNLQYPDSVIMKSIQGTVVIGFNVSKEGKIEDVKIVQSVDSNLDVEALRVIRLMPDWEPLIIGGIYCDSYQTQPVVFKLED